MSATTLQRPAAGTAPAKPAAPTEQEVQAYLRLGLRNRWWPRHCNGRCTR